MIIRLPLFAGFTLLFLAGSAHVSWARKPNRLPLNTERLQHAQEVERAARKQHNASELAEAYYLYGKTYVFAGDYLTAQQYFIRSLRLVEFRGDSFKLSRLYVRLSENERQLGHVSKARQYAHQALAVAQRCRSAKALVRVYGALGEWYENHGHNQFPRTKAVIEHSLFYYRQQARVCQQLNDSMGSAEASSHLGALLNRVRDPRAIPHLEKALHLLTLANKNGIRVKTMLHLARAYLMAGRTSQAFRMLRAADTLYAARKLNEYDIRMALESNYVLFYQTTGQWQRAFTHLSTLKSLEISQLMTDQDGVVSRLNIEYETEKKEARLKAQDRELTLNNEHLATQQWLTATVSVLLLLATGLSLVFFRLNRRNRRISRRNEELVIEQNHRVKNNLQVVSSLLSLQARRLSDETARRAVEESRLRVESMAILHRRLYDGDKLAAVGLHDFFPELVDSVLKTYGFTSVQTRFDIPPLSLSADKAVSLGLILNELSTNACKYAFPGHNAPRLAVRCRLNHQKLTLTVADNGPGPQGAGLATTRPTASKPVNAVADFSRPNQFDPMATVRESITVLLDPLPLKSPKKGFGLTLIQAQVKQLKGTARFEEGPPGGLLFTLECKV